jgi:uncharacterized protein
MDLRKMQTRNLALLVATTLVVAACGGSDRQPMTSTAPMNNAPVISGIVDKSIDQDSTLSVDFGVQDQETTANDLKVTAVANDGTLFPADGVVLSGTGATRTLTLTPLEAATGAASVSIVVTDADGGYAARTFKVAVNAKTVSMKNWATDTFAKGEGDAATSLNGVTFQQDADDPAAFAALVPAGEE